MRWAWYGEGVGHGANGEGTEIFKPRVKDHATVEGNLTSGTLTMAFLMKSTEVLNPRHRLQKSH
jgi:hypothetical protein